MTFNTAIAAAAAPITITVPDTAASLIRAARLLLPHLERGQAIDARTLRAAMEAAFAGSDADGAWTWKSAYDACEAAQVLFLRKFGPAIRARAPMPAARLAMLDRLAALTPSQTRRSEESQAFQQFSTPIALGFVASIAAALTPADLVLEPSAGTGLLAIFAEIDGASLALNELADSRAGLFDRLFPGLAVTRFDAAHIHDHLDAGNPAERRADEPAIFRGGACRGARRRRGAAPHRLRAGAARRGRPPGCDHRRQSLPRQSRLARRLHSIAGPRTCRVLRSHRRARLCPPRHHRRHAADRDRPHPGRRSRHVSRLARHRSRCRNPA